MGAVIFLGDELSACGYRLAGVDVRVPAPGSEAAALVEALGSNDVVLVASDLAGQLPRELLQRALRAPRPLTVLVPDLREGTAFADVSTRLRRQLGIEA